MISHQGARALCCSRHTQSDGVRWQCVLFFSCAQGECALVVSGVCGGDEVLQVSSSSRAGFSARQVLLKYLRDVVVALPKKLKMSLFMSVRDGRHI